MQPSNQILLLWDIDGTMFSSKAGQVAGLRLMEREFGRATMWRDEFHGTTDGYICCELLREYGHEPTEERVARYRTEYLKLLTEELQLQPYVVHDGVIEILKALQTVPHVKSGLLTGNWSAASTIKLTHAKLAHYFSWGAFSDDSYNRNELGPIALRKAKEFYGTDFEAQNVWIIGDSPRDIACAKAFGAKSLAVATGIFPSSELRRCEPEEVFENLVDTKRFLERVCNFAIS